MSLLEVSGLNSYYGDSHILFDVSMRVERNEVVALRRLRCGVIDLGGLAEGSSRRLTDSEIARVRDDYGGCRSWLEITRDLPFEGTPVLSDEEFERASEEIAGIVQGDAALAYA